MPAVGATFLQERCSAYNARLFMDKKEILSGGLPQMAGTLYVVATPIGNLEDITLRALRVLKGVALIAAEDTRRTRKLLSRYEINTPLMSCFREKELVRVKRILETLASGGDVALVSDAGTPAISDPGVLVVAKVREEGYKVEPLPGASAVTTALSVAALSSGPFLFMGFLPARSAQRRKALQEIANCSWQIVFYEAPHRIAACLADCFDVLGDREMFFARELTKVHEELFRGSIGEAITMLGSRDNVKGEFVVVLSGRENDDKPDSDSIEDLLVWYRDKTDKTFKDSVREVSHTMNVARTEVYKLALGLWDKRS